MEGRTPSAGSESRPYRSETEIISTGEEKKLISGGGGIIVGTLEDGVCNNSCCGGAKIGIEMGSIHRESILSRRFCELDERWIEGLQYL
ncbi:unnamed protein product [Microthlaspi erraticum]|uniref:Uncharacterized protein n=1 Tax=Microthlaspi erraticum TaxID=1685480 RepID=A0A6D2HLV1_9BRAS|nr:unnamed protein product [Microthlaspi erraticum]